MINTDVAYDIVVEKTVDWVPVEGEAANSQN